MNIKGDHRRIGRNSCVGMDFKDCVRWRLPVGMNTSGFDADKIVALSKISFKIRLLKILLLALILCSIFWSLFAPV